MGISHTHLQRCEYRRRCRCTLCQVDQVTKDEVIAPRILIARRAGGTPCRGLAGLTLKKAGDQNPNPIQHGGMGQAERAFSAASTFLSGFIGAPLKFIDPKFYESYMAWTKESFAVLVATITQWWSPTIVRVSGDESMSGQLFQMDDGSLKCNFPHRLILMANHQLYTDWLYLWWIAYTNKMHGRIYIIMKESLKKLPIFGWGAQFYNFIFLSRKWEDDQFRLRRAFDHLKNPKDPMWLMIFPEGTNLSETTRAKSAAWSKKTGLKDMKHQLLPRTTGLLFSLRELKQSTNWLYDATIAYEGVPPGMYGQDIFTLRASLFEGRPPKSVNIFWRRYRISEIPIDNEQAFSRWLMNRWREKDYILEYFYKFSKFPTGSAQDALLAVQGKREPKHANFISTEVKAGGWDEFLSIFGPITSTAGALSSIDLTDASSMDFDALLRKVVQQQQSNMFKTGKSPMPATSQEAIKRALKSASKAKEKLPGSILNDLLQHPPTSQQDMKQRLLNVGPPSIAPSTGRASTMDSRIPATAQNIQDSFATGPARAVKGTIPSANMEAMITRPLSTLATQSAVKARAAPAKQAAATATKKATPASQAQKAKLANTAATKRPIAQAKASNMKGPATASRAKTNLGTRVKGGTGSRPIGSQKYVTS
ncbi:acyltransferase-domain-containing protein [Polychaeton citri CBS 116435]|uniref:Acyltransferase-domain-containing protein n=1 Tax=Polychaeton citri CBS 116435 TaxID=1314669 RepID=A0A9P4Q5W4_9PEZI|nr:acyltransferase-domain-containing protein [Polychaeton citri CBS 116435]